MDLKTSVACALLCLVLAGCDPLRWKEISPAESLVELREQYRLPVPETKDGTIVYRAAVQSFRGEFVAIRMDAPEDALSRLEAAVEPNPSSRQSNEPMGYLMKVSENITWWPRPEGLISREYSMKPQGLHTYLLRVYFIESQKSPFALFILTPRKMYDDPIPGR